MKKFAVILGCAFMCLPLFVAAAEDTPSTTPAPAATTDTTQTTPDPTVTAPSGGQFKFQRQGVFDCNQNGSYAMSVGALSAIGGAYVPVADAAVELNTGTLVYKECVLREVVDRESEAAGTALAKQSAVVVLKGRGGSAMFVQNRGEIVTVVDDPTVLKFLQGPTLKNLSPPLQGPITRAIAKSYEVRRNAPETALKCPYGSNSIWDSVQSVGSVCNPIIAYYPADELMGAQMALNEQFQMDQWNWGRGFYSRVDENGNIVTPASIFQSSFQTQLDSPVHRLENANDIGQMIGALYAGINTQILADNQGLAGLMQSVGGQPSYLDQVAKESSQGLQGAALNAALQILNAAQQVESAYYQSVSAVGASLVQTRGSIIAAESQCWVNLIPKVCATSLSKDNTCTAASDQCIVSSDGSQQCPSPTTLKVATSTAFSQPIIEGQLTPLIAAAQTNIQSSQNALQLLSNLIQGITNTGSLDAQRVALQQLDTLVAQKKLHTQTNLATVVQQQSSVASAMGNLLQRTAQTWGGSGVDGSGNIQWDGTTNPGNGWCNINNSATQKAWIQTWTKK